jgi:hypothetical protein
MSFAVVEMVAVKADSDIEGAGMTGLNPMTKYEFKTLTDPKPTWQEANEDFKAYKLKHPTKIRVEVRNIKDLPPFIYL